MVPRHILSSLLAMATLSISACTMASSEPSSPALVALCPLEEQLPAARYQERYFTADGDIQTLLIGSAMNLPKECVQTLIDTNAEVLWAAPASDEQLQGSDTQFGLLGDFMRHPISISEVIVMGDSAAEPASSEEPQLPPLSASALTEYHANLQHGAWFWSPQIWLQTPGMIWDAQEQQSLSEVYISVPVNDEGGIEHVDELTQFIAQASERDLNIWVVIGDPHDVLASSLPAIENRIRAFLQYNAAASTDSQLSGIQLDIEPYLLPGFARSQGYWRDRYANVINHVHQLLDGKLPLDLVMPAWWGIHQQWGVRLFEQLPTRDVRFNIMNYHTSSNRLTDNAASFLRWGAEHDVAVMMALESGYLPTETHRRYRQHESQGELWLMPLGDEYIFVLFSQPQSNLPGRAYQFAFDYEVPASDYTFAGDLQRLNAVAAQLAAKWHLAPAFAGIAIHGLDDVRTNKDLNDQE